MKARSTIASQAWRLAMAGILVLVVGSAVSEVVIGEDAGQPIDVATQAAWLAQHFRCEHQGEMAEA